MPSADFRITHQSLARNAVANMQHNLARLSKLQDEVSSLKKLRRPSDSPVDMVSSLRLRGDIGRNEQILRNIEDAAGWLTTADSALTAIVDTVTRIRELVIQGRSAAVDANARQGIAVEIEKLRESMIGLANSKYVDRPVFGGTTDAGEAYQVDGTFVGVSNDIERTVAPGVRVVVNVNGDETFGPAGADLFTAIADIANAMRTDPTQLDALVTTLDGHTGTVQSKLAEVGARTRRLETMRDRNSVDSITLRQGLQTVEDADLAKSIMELQLQSTAYEAALSATARAIQPSLADFLR